jgi:hypothetical protein
LAASSLRKRRTAVALPVPGVPRAKRLKPALRIPTPKVMAWTARSWATISAMASRSAVLSKGRSSGRQIRRKASGGSGVLTLVFSCLFLACYSTSYRASSLFARGLGAQAAESSGS